MSKSSMYCVPLLDLQKEYQLVQNEILQAIHQVLDDMQLNNGRNVEGLESEFSSYCETKFAIGVGSGTEALLLSLLASDIGPGDEVITVSNTFIATIEAISFVGATPVFVDIDSRTQTMDVSQVEKLITPRTRAIIPVHLYGHPVDMHPIMSLAKNYNLLVIEDACQAHGAEYRGRKVGSIGDIGCFSFVYTKILNSYGDAGIVVTDNGDIATRIRLLRDHGRSARGVHPILGLNCRLDEIHAAVIRVKLNYLEQRIAKRRSIAEQYSKAFGQTFITIPEETNDVRHVYWQYVIQTDHRDELAQWLDNRNIASGVYYPIPCHLQQACMHFGYGVGSLPRTESAARQVLSLPVFPELEPEQIGHVIDSVHEFFA